MSKPNNKNLVNFLKIGRTAKEIAEHFSIPVEDIKNLVVGLEDEFNVFPSVNKKREPIFLAKEKPAEDTVPNRIWTYTVAKDEYGRPQPFITVRLPDDVPWEKVKIYPFGDLHYGAGGFDEEIFEAFMELITEKEYAFVVLPGDLIENALGGSIGGAVYEQNIPPRKQILELREKLRPIAHKALLYLPGNHEWRSFKAAGLDPLEFGFCEHLGIPYFSEPVHLDILWHGQVFSFYIRHGKGNAATPGGKMNIVAKPLSANEHMHFTVMGHVHVPASDKNIKRCREYIYDDNGDILDMRIVERTEHLVICSAIYKFFGTYGSRAEYSANAKKLVHACVLEPSGKYYLEKKPLITKK
ncbi:MAG: metallophosphoesterase [Parcubacteria group bacterium]|nr:metallophosphoesterase [Parcubacteria group bacterium]